MGGSQVKHFLPQIINYFQGLLPASARSSDRRKTVVKLLLSYGVQAPVEIGIWRACRSHILSSLVLTSFAPVSAFSRQHVVHLGLAIGRSDQERRQVRLWTHLQSEFHSRPFPCRLLPDGFAVCAQATLIAQTIAVLLARRLGEQKTAKWAAILQFVTGCIGMTIVKKRAVPSSPGGGGGASAGREGKGKGKASSGGGGKGGGLGGASWSGGGSSSFGGGGSGYVVSGGGQQQEGVGYRGKFPTWQPGVDYKVGDHVYFRDKDYAVEQAHRSQVRSQAILSSPAGPWCPVLTDRPLLLQSGRLDSRQNSQPFRCHGGTTQGSSGGEVKDGSLADVVG